MSRVPKVLLLGDSIRISYQPIVKEKLRGIAEVVGPEDNCQYSLYTLSSLDRWINSLGQPDIVHWNNGIHDAGHNPKRFPVQIPLEMYRANLELIVKRLREMTPHVIFATSTPVHPKRPFLTDQWAWRNEEIEQYNSAAVALMKTYQVTVNDLHAVVLENVDEYLAEDQLHLSPIGQRKCGEIVVKAIEPYVWKITRNSG